VVVELVAVPGWTGDPYAGLRRLLKLAGRGYGWRCVRLAETPADLASVPAIEVER
jgi:hypothetical protein